MKDFFDISDQEEFKQWADEICALAQIPTQHSDVTAYYRKSIEEWYCIETWQREELMESYEKWLSELAADSSAYCSVKLSVGELRNLSIVDLDNFSSYVITFLPSRVVHERNEAEGLTEEHTKRALVKFQKLLNDALERERILDEISKIGQ